MVLYLGTTGALAMTDTAFSTLQEKCGTSEKRRRFLEDIVVDNVRVAWRDCELSFAFSLKADDRDWCFGLFDPTLKKLLAGSFEASAPRDPGSGARGHYGDEKALQFTQEITDSLSISATDFDDVATSLMIARIRETAEDELFDRGVPGDEIDFPFGDPSAGVSPRADRCRREAIFKALCALRFVRLGVSK